MSDFLTTLVARTLGSAQVVGPRRPARFEADSPGAAPDERAELESTGPSSLSTRIPPAVLSEQPPQRRRDRETILPQSESQKSATAAHPNEAVRPESVRYAPVVEGSTTTRATPEIATPGARAGSVATIRPVRSVSAASPTRTAISRADPARRDYAEAAPAIHITIGRVDVRAIHRPEPAPAARKNAEPPRLSLGAYLRGRRD